MDYIIDYHNGFIIDDAAGTLEEIKAIADDAAGYTQCNITIKNADSEPVARRMWYGVAFDPAATEESENEIISFGDFGYYGAWCDL